MGDALIGTIVEDRYLVESELGAGAMGRVYRARHIKVGREVAIKVMRADLSSEARLVERFEREALIAAQLQHPNVVGVLDVGTTPTGESLMVMELAPGRPLSDLVGAPMPHARAVNLLTQLLRGLSHAHAAGLIHRDLKPDNVLLDDDDHARIVDFGIAVLRDRTGAPAGRRLTEAGLVVGTPMYMAPEQATGKPIDHRADLFSLGVIGYELLAGATPFEGTAAEVALANVTKDPPWIADRVRGVAVDPLLEAFVRKLMARRLADRFESAHAALLALELMDRDRDAAAQQLGLVTRPTLEAPPALLRLPRDSDALSTQPMAEPAFDDAPDADADAVPADPDATDLIARAPRRSWWPVFAAAVAVATLGIAWRLVQVPGSAAASPVPAVAMPPRPTVIELPEPPLPSPTVHAPSSAATTPARVARDRHRMQAPPPAAVQPPPPAAATDDSPDALAARYRAIGEALRKANGADELWQRYRLIHLGDAMATPATRAQALATLDAIERALPVHS
jgi:serine/threonine protein kinase